MIRGEGGVQRGWLKDDFGSRQSERVKDFTPECSKE